MPARQRITDQQIRETCSSTGSVHKAAAILGVTPSAVHERVRRLGIGKTINKFTEAERDVLRAEYAQHRADGTVAELASRMGRTVQFLSRKARELGLTDARHDKLWHGRWKYMEEEEARAIFEDFKSSKLPLGEFCAARGYSDDGLHLAVRNRWPDEWEIAVEAAVPIGSLYQVGRAFEFKVRDHLAGAGFHAMRSDRSLGPADVVAYALGQILFVQCKGATAVIDSMEWNRLLEVAASVGAIPIVASPKNGVVTLMRITGPKDGLRQTAIPWVPFQAGVDVTVEPLTVPSQCEHDEINESLAA